MPTVTVQREACKGIDDCGICAFVCPEDLYRPSSQMNQRGYYPPELTDPGACTGCQNCMVFCPDFAIVVTRETTRRPRATKG